MIREGCKRRPSQEVNNFDAVGVTCPRCYGDTSTEETHHSMLTVCDSCGWAESIELTEE
jgi:hypothetical protein